MIQVAMWGKALRIIPRVTKDEWNALDVISRWLIATRAAVFILTALSALVGGLLALRAGSFHLPYFLACLGGLIFAHASNNLINDWVDHKKGIDKDNYYRAQYGPQPLEHGLLTQTQFGVYLLVTGLIALAMGLYLVVQTGAVTLTLLALGAFFVLFYTWPLKYIGLGEPTVLLVWGPLMVGGTYYVVTGGQWDWSVLWVSLAYAIGPTTVLFGKHIDKIEQDRAKRVYTLPVILGERAARLTTIGLWMLQYILVAALVLSGLMGFALLLVWLSLPKLSWVARVFARPRPKEAPADLPPNVWPLYLSAHAFVYNRHFGTTFFVSLLLEVLMRRFGLGI